MADETLKVSIEAEDNASGDLRGVATGISNLSEKLDSAVKSLQAAARQSNALERAVAGVGKGSKGASDAIDAATGSLSKYAAEAKTASEFAREHSEAVLGSLPAHVTAHNRAHAAALKQTEQVRALGVAYQEAANWANKMGAYVNRAQQPAFKAQGDDYHRGLFQQLDDYRGIMARESSYMNAEIARSMEERARREDAAADQRADNARARATELEQIERAAQQRINKSIVDSMRERMAAEDQATERIKAESAERTAAYTREYEAAVKIEKSMAADRDAKRYAAPVNPQRNNGGSTLTQRRQAQDAYSRVELSQMGEYYAALERTSAATNKVTQSTSDMSSSMFTARFALHDISNTAGIAGAALIGMAGAGVSAAMQYESAMASIERTSGATRGQMQLIRDEFVDLAQSIPAGFDEMAQIGELAGQLNIAAADISNFTETVAKFTSSTDVTVQASAEAFGRLDELLPDVQHNYEALGSSILNVGVNSVATESAIISTTSQIAAAGAQAGFTAGEVIGLAASYASLGIAPEAARGSTIRIFSEIRQATAEGGAALESYADIAGMSASAFADSWKQAPADAFMEFLRGLQTQGANAESTLRSLGITGVRDINALLRMSQNSELVAENLGYAIDGFQNASALSEAYGITSQTLAARLQVLAQTVQALFATLGETSSGPLKEFVNLLIDAGVFLTDALNNPIGQTIALMGGLSAVLGGGVLLLASVISRAGALGVALRITQRELMALVPASVRAGTAVGTMGQRMTMAATQALTLRNAIRAIGATTVIGAAITGIVMGIEAIGNASRTSGEIARDRFGDLSSLMAAVRKDTTELADNAGSALGSFTVEVEQISEKHSDWNAAMQEAGISASTLDGAVKQVSEGVREQTYLIGENTRAWWATQLAGDEAMKEMFQTLTEFNNKYGTNIDPTGLLRAQISGNAEAIKTEMDKIQSTMIAFQQEYIATTAKSEGDVAATVDNVNALEVSIEAAMAGMSAAYTEAAANTEYLTQVSEITGVSMETLTGVTDEYAGSVDNAGSAIRDAVNEAFGMSDALGAMTQDADRLFNGLANSSNGFNALTVDGAQNVENLKSAIITSISAGESMGVSAVNSVAALFLELERRGVDTANFLASLASIPGIGIAGVSKVRDIIGGSRGLTPAAESLSTAFQNVGRSAGSAARGTGNAGRAAGGAAKEVRTLTDYANDLSKVWSRAFEIRFSGGQALDKITSSWRDMSEAIVDARREYEETQRKISELNTERQTLLYFQQVAIDYGDALRAAEIADELAKNNAKLTEENESAAEAQSKMDRSLTGNSKAAINNRQSLLGLVEEYQDYMQSLAASGMSQAELQAKSVQLRAEFVQQATRMGYNRNEVAKYAMAFDDMTLAINKVPRKVTIEANANPAMTALKELEAQAKRTASAVGGVGGGLAGGAADMGRAANRMRYHILYLEASANAAINSSRAVLAAMAGDPFGAISYRVQAVAQGAAALAYRRAGGFKSGGYTGDVGVSDVAGVVHGKEFVVNAENTSRLGLDYLNALNSGKTPAVPVGNGSMNGPQVIELSAYDRQLLAAAGNVSLSIDGRVIAQAGNAANFVSTKKGTN